MLAAKFEGSSFVLASEYDYSCYPNLSTYAERTVPDGSSPASLADVVSPFQDADGMPRVLAPVANLTVTRETSTGREILLCVRKSDDEVHPDVVSSPTMRIPPAFLAIFNTVPVAHEDPRLIRFDGRQTGGEYFSAGTTRNRNRPPNSFAWLAANIMSVKLGAAEPLAREDIDFFAYPEAMSLETVRASVTEELEDILETVAMINIAVEVSTGSDQFPERSAAHQKIFWAEIGAFGRSWETKDLSYILPPAEIDPFRMCFHGACVASAYRQFTQN